MRSRAEIIDQLSFYMKEGTTPSEAGIRCAVLLDSLVGLHHIDGAAMKKADWTNDRWLQITLNGSFSTCDYDDLTRMVFLAHDMCIRIEIVAATRGRVSLMLHPRHTRNGQMSKRHCTIETALANFRTRHLSLELFEPGSVEPGSLAHHQV
jgi:hypothetical protein